MDKYQLLTAIGDGTYGTVLKGIVKKTGEPVAIKRMKQRYNSWEQCVRLPEVVVLRKLHSCPNIIKLREVIRENSTLYFVFDFMDGDLLGIIKQFKGSGIPTARVKSMTVQILQALAQMHKAGFFHRDMKPENVLVKKDGGAEILKLADLGLVKEIRGRPPFTDYVSTRWYRSPEILLQDKAYNSPVDIWALGCMIIELFTTRPLFPGANEVDQLFKIVQVMGTPTEKQWPEGMQMAKRLRYQWPGATTIPLSRMFPNIPSQAIDLITKMLSMNPRNRPTAAEALQHPWLRVNEVTPYSLPAPSIAAPGRVPGKSTAPSSQQVNSKTTTDWADVTGTKLPAVSGGIAAGMAGKPSSAERPVLPVVEIARYKPPVGSSATPTAGAAAAASTAATTTTSDGTSVPVVQSRRTTVSQLPPVRGAKAEDALPPNAKLMGSLGAGKTLRDSFDGLFGTGKPSSRAPSLGGTLGNGASNTAAAAAATDAALAAAGLGSGRGTGGGGVTGGAAPFESPLAKLLGASRYRSASFDASSSPKEGAGGAASGSGNRRPTVPAPPTFASPAYAKKPTPLSAAILAQVKRG